MVVVVPGHCAEGDAGHIDGLVGGPVRGGDGLVVAGFGRRVLLRRLVALRRKGMASVVTGMLGVGALATFGTGVGPQGTSAAVGVAGLVVGGAAVSGGGVGLVGSEVVLEFGVGEGGSAVNGWWGMVAAEDDEVQAPDGDADVVVFDLEASFLDDDGADGLGSSVSRAFYLGFGVGW